MRRLQTAVLEVEVADQAEPVGADRQRRPPAGVAGARDDRDRRARADDVRAMRRLQVVIGGVVVEVADEAEAVGADGRRGVSADARAVVDRAGCEPGSAQACTRQSRRASLTGSALRPGNSSFSLTPSWPL